MIARRCSTSSHSCLPVRAQKPSVLRTTTMIACSLYLLWHGGWCIEGVFSNGYYHRCQMPSPSSGVRRLQFILPPLRARSPWRLSSDYVATLQQPIQQRGASVRSEWCRVHQGVGVDCNSSGPVPIQIKRSCAHSQIFPREQSVAKVAAEISFNILHCNAPPWP